MALPPSMVAANTVSRDMNSQLQTVMAVIIITATIMVVEIMGMMIMAIAGSATGTVVTTAGKNVFAGLKENAFFGIVVAMTDGKMQLPSIPYAR